MKNLLIILGVIAAAVAAYYLVGAYYLDTDSSENNGTDEMDENDNENNNSASSSVSSETSDEANLTDSTWSWQYTELQSGERVNAPGGDQFVLSFEADGRMTSTTDCNNLGGTASVDGEVLSMGQFISTLMYCEGSKEQEYAEHLGLVNSYAIAGDQLTLNMNRDYGVMVFNRYNQ